MSDPVSGGIGKASQQMMQELQKNMSQQAEAQKVGGGQFNDVMAQGVQQPNQVNQTQQVQEVNKVQETTKAADVLRVAANDPSKLGVKPVEAAGKSQEAGLKQLLGQVVEGQNKLDKIIEMSLSGKSYGNQELLAIQAAVYKFSQELELTSKVVEKATSGVKQTMQTQV
jgi:hypothetical protein